jgi:hypothetical protein
VWNRCVSLLVISGAASWLGITPLFTNETGVQETFQKLLSLAVVLQLIPFLYMFAALLKISFAPDFRQAKYSKTKLMVAGTCGLVTTTLGIGLAFFPAQQITSLLSYEVWMWGGTVLFIGAAAFFFFVYGRRKAALKAAV